MEYRIGEIVKVINNTVKHGFEIGTEVRVLRVNMIGQVEEAELLDSSDYWHIDNDDVIKLEQ
jgi:hypothetical protein